MKAVLAIIAMVIGLSALADTNIRVRPYQQQSVVTTYVKVFLDEYGVPYNAIVVQTSYVMHADQLALQQAMRQTYEPVQGPQGERVPGWRIVYFNNRPF